MKNNTLPHSTHTKATPYTVNSLVYKNISCFITFCLLLIGSIFNVHGIATAQATNSPFHYEHTWAKFNNYIVLNVTLHAESGNYTYAPHQENVYPTKFTLYLDASQKNTTPKSSLPHSMTLESTPPRVALLDMSPQSTTPLNVTPQSTIHNITLLSTDSLKTTPSDTISLNTNQSDMSPQKTNNTAPQNRDPQGTSKINTIQLNTTSHNTKQINAVTRNINPQNITLQNVNQLNITQDIPILFPLGIKKPDPLNKSVQVYVYEKNQNIFILFPATFAPLGAHLELSFLACSELRCQPLKMTFPLSHINNIQDAKSFPWFKEFEKRFIAMQNKDTTQVNIGHLNIKSKQQHNSISNVPTNIVPTTGNATHSSTKPQTFLPPTNTSPATENQNTTSHSLSTSPNSNLVSNSKDSPHTNSMQDFDIDALRASMSNEVIINNKESQKNKEYTFSPRPLNSSLEVSDLYKALLFGLLAGFILNFMPCVLPVIALKISAFLGTKQSDQTRYKSFREHNIFFALGIITWFMTLGLLLGLAGLSWGQLFQNPLIVLALLIFIFAMSLSLFGIFHLPILDLRIIHDNKKIKQNEKLQAFTSGLLATLLATPCSGPLLGSVLGYSLTQSIPILLTIFFAMGFGMALPYVFFAINPRLIRFMPRAGNWLNTMEQILGFFLMATSIYLLSILPSDWYIKSLIILLLVSLSAYIWGKWGSFHSSGLKKVFIALLCVSLIAIPSSYLLQKKEQNVFWENFTYEQFDELLGEEILLLKFTADWCPTCKVLEQTVFTKKNMQNIANNYNIRFIYVDITEFNEEKQNLLKSLDSVSIPLLAVFPKGDLAKSPIIIRDLYTLKQLEEAIRLAH